MLYEVAWNLNRGKPASRVIIDKIDKKIVLQLFCERHKMVDDGGFDVLPARRHTRVCGDMLTVVTTPCLYSCIQVVGDKKQDTHFIQLLKYA